MAVWGRLSLVELPFLTGKLIKYELDFIMKLQLGRLHLNH